MAADIVMGPVVGWVARDDAVEIGRIPLRFDHRFVAALRASTEIGTSRLCAVERFEDHFVGFRHEMGCAVGKIHDAFVVSERPFAVGAATLMAGVRAAGGVALLQRLHHRRETDGTCHATVAHTQQFVIPLLRHPQLYPDFLAHRRRHAAECGRLNGCPSSTRRTASRQGERTGRNGCGGSNRDARHGYACEALTGLLSPSRPCG